MDLAGKRVLVTGGAGFIGSHLADNLMREGCRVRVIDNLSNGRQENLEQHKKNSRFEFVKGDITRPSEVEKAIVGADVLFHLACLGVRHSIKHPFENHRVNAEGTLVVLQEAYKAGVKRFIYCSSSEVYGTADNVPMKESHPTYPCTVYGAGKLAGEAYSRAYHKTYGMPVVITRLFNAYGPRSHHEGDTGEVIPKSIVRALNGEPIIVFGDGRQTRDFTYVEDSARALVEAARCDKAVGMTLNIGSGSEVSVKEAAGMLLKISHSSSKIKYLEPRPGDVLRLCADSTLFKKLTGWKNEMELRDGLEKTIEWFRMRPEGISKLLRQEVSKNWE